MDRLKQCDNIVDLAKALGISRRLLYAWREQLNPVETSEGPRLPTTSRESTLRREVSDLKRMLAGKLLEVDFFTGALQKVEARRQRRGKAGAQASTTRFGP